jgi:hypothetical protein
MAKKNGGSIYKKATRKKTHDHEKPRRIDESIHDHFRERKIIKVERGDAWPPPPPKDKK